jgi:hypothetical protein
MGGLGSGRWQKPGRKTVDSCPVLDVNYLSVKGYLQPGRTGPCLLPFGSETILIDLHAEAGHLCLSQHSANTSSNTSSSSGSSGGFSGEREGVIAVIPITYKSCGFVGNRAYFVCSGGPMRIGSRTDDAAGAVDAGGGAAGVVCGRRVTKLYFSGGRFLCRHCSQLVYVSKYEQQPWERASRRANKLRQRLGITGLGVPEKPYGMSVLDYERLLEATLQAEMLETEACTARLLQLAAWIERRHNRRKPQFTL